MFQLLLATHDDAPRCADIHGRSWMFAYSDVVGKDIIESYNARWPIVWTKMLENNTDTHYVILDDDMIVGFTSINPSRDADAPDGMFELTGLYLDPNHIGKGYGKQAMEWAKHEASARGYTAISLWVLDQNDRAKRFYEKAGFIPDGTKKNSGLGDTQEERYIWKTKENLPHEKV